MYKNDTKLPIAIHGVGSAIAEDSATQHAIKRIDVVSLDKELKRLGIQKVDFVKMDIEGAEIEAVKGLRQTVKNNKKIHLAIASYHIVNGKKTYLTLEPFFRSLGMKVFTRYKDHLTTYVSWK